MSSEAKQSEPSDNHVYNLIFIYKDTFDLLLRSLCFYRDLLQKQNDVVNLDADLKLLLADGPEGSSVLRKELRKVQQAISWWEDVRSKAGVDAFDYNIGSFSHGTIRFLKSVAMLYLSHLRQKRNALSQQPGASKYVLESLDTTLARFEEKMQATGVFGMASTLPLLVEEAVEISLPTSEEFPQRDISRAIPKQASPVLLESIPILDPVLRARCLDLYFDFEKGLQHDRFDTVIAEATKILEDRLRAVLGVTSGTGDDLAAKAFAGATPRLRVSSVASEQGAVLLFFKGVFGHIRNPSHHKLLGNLSSERTLQILGMVDYALHLLETAEKTG